MQLQLSRLQQLVIANHGKCHWQNFRALHRKKKVLGCCQDAMHYFPRYVYECVAASGMIPVGPPRTTSYIVPLGASITRGETSYRVLGRRWLSSISSLCSALISRPKPCIAHSPNELFRTSIRFTHFRQSYAAITQTSTNLVNSSYKYPRILDAKWDEF